MQEKLAAIQQSGLGRFFKKFSADRGTNLAILLAWGTLNTIIPVLLGLSAIVGLVFRDPERQAQITSIVFNTLPPDTADLLRKVLTDLQENAGVVGIVGLLLLLNNGSGFFANMEGVFNQVYRVQDRNFLMQRVMALAMMLLAGLFLVITTTAYSAANILGSASDAVFGALPVQVPAKGLVAVLIGGAISLVSATVLFMLLYRILPNKAQTWRQVLPGSILATVLFLVLLQIFPLYLQLFGTRFRDYAIFGTFLLFMFYAYLQGLILVLGAELNAYLQDPSTADQPVLTYANQFLVDDGRSGPQPVQVPVGYTASRAKGRLQGLVGLAIAAILLKRGGAPKPEPGQA